MQLVFITDHMKFSGGRRLMFDYALYLMGKGHQVDVLVEKKEGELADYIPAREISSLDDPENFPECDLIIATSPKEVRQAWKVGGNKTVHFCQGLEIIDLEQRINGQVLPPRLQGQGLMRKLRIMRKKRAWKKKLKKFDDVYRLPTHLVAITVPMKEWLEHRYGRRVYLCRNGVDLDTLKPREGWEYEKFSKSRPLRLINIGPEEVTYKGIPTTLEAVKKAREKGLNIEFTRITPTNLDTPSPSDYHLVVNIPKAELAAKLRNSDIYLSNSTEREGFGLPAIEAAASGLLCILSDITAYRSFSSRDDYCIFVPEGDSDATVSALERIYNMPGPEFRKMRNNSIEVASEFSHNEACSRFENILMEISREK